MDQKLLNALNNIGLALEELVDALNTKSEAKTATSTAIQSGNFVEDLKSINEGIKSIKADTQTIIKNQQTIIAQGKERESAKTKDIETDPKKEGDIKRGVGTILLIAVAVLAIGMAFKLVGDVNILSVIGLALGITLVAIAFEKVAELKLDLKEAAIAAAVMVISSLGLMISSHILNLVQPVTPIKMLTAIFIAAGFAVLGPSISKLVVAFKGMSIMDLIKTVIFLPLILPAISLGIALSSEFLQRVQPIGLSQFISSILISGIFVVLAFGLKKMIGAFSGINPIGIILGAIFLPIVLVSISKAIADSSESLSNVKMISLGSFFSALLISVIFVVISYSIKNMISAFKDINPVVALVTALFLPTILVSISQAISDSSQILSNVKMIGLSSFFGAILVSAIFVVISWGLKRMISAFRGIDPATALTASITIPILMVAISGAIWLSSILLDKMTIVSEDKLINAGLIGAGLAILSIAIAPAIKMLSKIGIADIIKGALMIPIIATTIMISSLILNLGKYDGDFPTTEWIKGVSLSILVFGAATIGLGLLITASGGLGLPALALGAVGVLIVGAAIAATSHVLKLGDYKTSYPGLDWAKGVSLSLVAFGGGMVLLGGIIFASFGLGLAMLKAGSNAVLMVAKTIVGASDILANGYEVDGKIMKPNYKGGPTKEWAEGVSIALGAFSPIYGMLMKNAIFSIFGRSGVGPDDFTNAIKTVSKGIVSAANFFASPENPGVWAGHPTKEWAEGVGLAIGAFAPVFEVLTNQSWFSKTVKVEDMVRSIITISQGIVAAAKFFAENTSPFKEGNYPSKSWGEGVGASLGAFAPVFDMLMKKSGFWKSGVSVINDMIKGIVGISTAIVKVAVMFTLSSKGKIFESYPDKNWAISIKSTIEKFVEISNYLTSNKDVQYWRTVNLAKTMSNVAKLLSGDIFNKKIDKDWSESIKSTIDGFFNISKYINENKNVQYWRTISLAKTMSNVAKLLSGDIFNNKIDKNWSFNVKSTIEGFFDISNYLTKNKDVQYWRTVNLAKTMSNVAKLLSGDVFDTKIDKDWSNNIDKLVKTFTNTSKYLTENKDVQYWRTINLAKTMLNVAKILTGDIFDNKIDKDWSESIKSPIYGFIDISKYLTENKDVQYWRTINLAKTMSNVAKLLSGDIFNNKIDKDWSESIKSTIDGFFDISNYLTKNKDVQYWRTVNLAKTMSNVAKLLSGDIFNNKIDKDWSNNIDKLVKTFINTSKYLTENKDVQYWRSTSVAKTMVNVAKILTGDVFDNKIDKDWSESIKSPIYGFVDISNYLTSNKDVQYWRSTSVAKTMVNVAKLLTGDIFNNNNIDINWSNNIDKLVKTFTNTSKYLTENKDVQYWRSTSVAKTMSNVAKILTGDIFDNKIDKDWSESIKSPIYGFVDISKYLTENKDVQYWRFASVAKRLKTVAKILFNESEIFSKTIDPNFIINISKNMLDFNQLVNELITSESGGMLSKLGDSLLGTDPITQIAKRMVTLADGYDKLAESLIKLGGAMKVLNISDIRMLGGLSPALAKPDESKKGGLMDSAKSLFGFKKAETGPTVGAGAQGAGGEESSLKEDMTKIIKLLTNIDKSTEESSLSLSDMLVQLRDEGVRTVNVGN
jgi:hypothetical protein